ncbi:AraC family transcriptional regulator [Labedella endophytica]|uniref:AraC family transcriptional regulator n=1 Tax=Labedella endophytica TaxID=1523160 RepID=A0A3S0VBV9_9MICO|nr:AraC family transcriptional regulator [Labedella endophytica]RUR01861.1 AraC family transcriptional regulator [Labedella endophytica]
MDPLDRLMHTRIDGRSIGADPRARGAFALRIVMTGRWAIDVDDDAALSVLIVLAGHAVLDRSGSTVGLSAGDVVLLPRGESYSVADAAGSPRVARISPGQVCTSVEGADLSVEFGRGVRSWGNATDGMSETTMLLGAYEHAGAVGPLTLASLPAVAHVRDGAAEAPVVALLAAEMGQEGIGQQTVIDRLLDVLVVTAVRSFSESPGYTRTGWLGATGDPVVEHALRLLHAAPEEPWTIERLAHAAHVSRATLAARFRRRVGVAPMTYLSEWRLRVASEMLLAGASVGEVADAVGYASPFSFSAAFRRHHGVTPSEVRRRAAGR